VCGPGAGCTPSCRAEHRPRPRGRVGRGAGAASPWDPPGRGEQTWRWAGVCVSRCLTRGAAEGHQPPVLGVGLLLPQVEHSPGSRGPETVLWSLAAPWPAAGLGGAGGRAMPCSGGCHQRLAVTPTARTSCLEGAVCPPALGVRYGDVAPHVFYWRWGSLR